MVVAMSGYCAGIIASSVVAESNVENDVFAHDGACSTSRSVNLGHHSL